jgi:adenylate cyclase
MILVMWRPVRAWERGARDEAATIAAWRTLASLPIEYLRRVGKAPFLFAYLPFIAFTTWELHLSWYLFWILAAAGTVVLAYSLIVRYFTMEIVVRPVLEEVARELPPDFIIDARGLPLRWRLLAVAPVINVINGVVVAGLSANGHHATLDDLGLLAEGLDERERLREALGAYVDPEVAERILKEGPDLAGEEIEASILFLDIRDFTAFTERSQPAEVVALLNELWSLVVPVLLRHGGHANKFIGDGLLGAFGAPEPHRDHAARAVRAALEIVHEVRRRYQGRIAVGIGVNTGSVVAGTVGGGGRVEFTVIGDAVNTASRVEKLTREIGDNVLITEETCAQLSQDEFTLERRQDVAVRGKQAGVQLWAPHPRAVDTAGARGRARAAPVSD